MCLCHFTNHWCVGPQPPSPALSPPFQAPAPKRRRGPTGVDPWSSNYYRYTGHQQGIHHGIVAKPDTVGAGGRLAHSVYPCYMGYKLFWGGTHAATCIFLFGCTPLHTIAPGVKPKVGHKSGKESWRPNLVEITTVVERPFSVYAIHIQLSMRSTGATFRCFLPFLESMNHHRPCRQRKFGMQSAAQFFLGCTRCTP